MAQLPLVDFRLLLGRRVDVFEARVAVDDRARVRVLVLLVRTQVAAVEVERDLGVNGFDIFTSATYNRSRKISFTSLFTTSTVLATIRQLLQLWHL